MAQSPLKAIKEHCYQCSGENYAELDRCPCTTCILYPFRKGTNPFRTKREYTEEERQAIAERLKKNRGNKKE